MSHQHIEWRISSCPGITLQKGMSSICAGWLVRALWLHPPKVPAPATRGQHDPTLGSAPGQPDTALAPPAGHKPGFVPGGPGWARFCWAPAALRLHRKSCRHLHRGGLLQPGPAPLPSGMQGCTEMDGDGQGVHRDGQKMHKDAQGCTEGAQGLTGCAQGVHRGCTGDAQEYTGVHRGAQGRTEDAQECTGVHRGCRGDAEGMHRDAQGCTGVHRRWTCMWRVSREQERAGKHSVVLSRRWGLRILFWAAGDHLLKPWNTNSGNTDLFLHRTVPNTPLTHSCPPCRQWTVLNSVQACKLFYLSRSLYNYAAFWIPRNQWV